MNSTSALKVSVNGRKYLITGIQKDAQRKDLLCAIAKTTSNNNAEGKSIKGFCDDNRESNLIEHFKKDCKTNSDLKSFKVFDSLGKEAKIVQKDRHRPRKKPQQETSDGVAVKYPHKRKKRSQQHSSKQHRNKQQKRIGRSYDDSDLERFTREKLRRKNINRRTLDDSDLHLYKSLVNVVRHQRSQLRRLQLQSKHAKKSEWFEQLKKELSRVYFIDGCTDMEIDTFLNDDGIDSGLPSPDFDSSESQDAEPTFLPSIINDYSNIEQLFSDQIAYIESELNKNQNNKKHDLVKKQNKGRHADDSLHNTATDQRDITRNDRELAEAFLLFEQTFEKKCLLNESRSSISDLQPLACERVDASSNMSPIQFGMKCEENIGIDKNKNFFNEITKNENMFDKRLIDTSVIKTISTIESRKKLEKRRINKSDISEPVLNSFRRHSSYAEGELTKTQETNRHAVCNGTSAEQKESKYNKKIKELRRNLRLKSKPKSNEPEYMSKNLFAEIPVDIKTTSERRPKNPNKETRNKDKHAILDTKKCAESGDGNLSIAPTADESSIHSHERNIEKETDLLLSEDCFLNRNECVQLTVSTCDNLNANSTNNGRLNSPSQSYEMVDDREIMENEYLEQYFLLLDADERLLDLKLITTEISEELDILSDHSFQENLDETEHVLNEELGNVRRLLQSVADLTAYQRKEMTENMGKLDQLDMDLRTKQAGFENIRSGVWKTSARYAPRSLLKHSKKSRKHEEQSSSFV